MGSNYSSLGTFLLDDKTGAKVRALEIEYKMNAEAINEAIFRKWLNEEEVKPVTWQTLITQLRTAKLNALAREIEIGLA